MGCQNPAESPIQERHGEHFILRQLDRRLKAPFRRIARPERKPGA
jgi:hypothetical protein